MDDEQRRLLELLLLKKQEDDRKAEEEARNSDPLNWYNEHPMEDYWMEEAGRCIRLGPSEDQLSAMLCTKPYRMVEGGNRSGKTVQGLVEVAMYARNRHPVRKWTIPPKILVLITRRQQAKMVWQKRLFDSCEIFGPAYDQPLIPESEIADKSKSKDIDYTYAGSEKVMVRVGLKNGAAIHFYWSGAAQAWQNIEGVTFDAVVRDESTKDAAGNDHMMTEIKMRLFDSQCHPTKKKEHAGWLLWVSTDTKPSAERDEYKAMAQSGDPDWGYFRLRPGSNPMITMEDLERQAKSMSDEDAAVRVWGTAGADDRLRVFAKHFNQELAVYKTSYFPLPTDNLWAWIDPAFGRTGSFHGIALVAISQAQPTTYKVIAEDARKNCTVQDQIEILLKMMASVERCDLEGVCMDPAAAKTESTGQSVYTQYMKEILRRGVQVHRGQVVLGRNRKDDVYPLMQTVLQQNRLLINPECGKLVRQINECKTKEPTVYSGPRGVVDKHLDVLKAVQYGISRGPVWVDRGVAKKARPNSAAEWSPDMGFDVTDDMDDASKKHIYFLRRSADLVKRFQKRRGSMLQTVRMY
jgi:hypothetical protein